MGDIKKVDGARDGGKNYKWTIDTTHKEEADILIDFLSQLEKQPDWKSEVTVNNNDNNGNNNNNNNDNHKITLESASIVYLSDFTMTYELSELLILHIGLQMQVLHTYKKGVFFFNLDDIIVINKTFFFLSNLCHVLDTDPDDQLILTYPMKFSKQDEAFLAPEVLTGRKVLPFITSISAGYYSLAKLCVYCLGLEGEKDELGSIMGSKMYFFLERCLAKEPRERVFLYL